MRKKKLGIISSFGFALKGCRTLLHSERNVRIHVLALFVVTLMGMFFHISTLEWAIVVLCSGAVLAAEAINTAIEEMVDLLHPARSEKAGRIKDIAAAGVLILAIASLTCGLFIFLPKILLEFQ